MIKNSLSYSSFSRLTQRSMIWFHTGLSQSPCSMILRWVNLPVPAVSYCTSQSHSWPQPFLKTYAQALKGTVSHKWMWILILLIKGYIFSKSFRIHFFTLRSMILRRVSFLDTKIWIPQRNLHQNWKYFNPLVSGPYRFEL